ncbi:protein pxr1 [Sesamum indicum]|uniref:Protein pxr1 n=1 Tax=Sesamum indicum TaxID=4182 RepID=A0A6I9SLZ4_SESIN|nr:protein pxr1 [Sesamum indicum]XP_011070492.1 protein pxr1 [Sesamum indicum]XP_011070493.1 protein pxr1 [Sesamum indicum]XP_020547515.1 protein pxr1 [Sesamum indicum]XP_020547516.1 protein pxr1 [Sesamum indicum]
MRKISGQVLSTKPVSLARAAKLVSRFAGVDNGSSSAVSLYLQRTAEAFNHLVQFHSKRKTGDLENSPDRKRVQNEQTDGLEKNPYGKEAQDGKRRGKRERKTETGVAEENPFEDEVRVSKSGAEEQMKEKKKKKKRESDGVDLEGKSNSKKSSKKSRRHEGPDS